MILATDFGIYVADEVQKVQLIFLTYCINSSAVNNAVQKPARLAQELGGGRSPSAAGKGARVEIVALLSSLSR